MREFKGYQNGINFGGWLSQCDSYTKEHYDSFITEKDFEITSGRGYDHVRVPIDYELILNKYFDFIDSGFAYIDFAIDMCRKYHLNMVLDLHKTPGYSFDPFHNEKGLFESVKLQKVFFSIWEELAKRYSHDSDMLAFELLNEVTDIGYMDTWNTMSRITVDIIRKYSKDIKILIGGYNNNSIEALRAISNPYDDNIVYNFHFYEPLIFTHQGAYWIATMDTEFRCPFDMTYDEYEKYSKRYLCQAYADFGKYDPEEKMSERFFADLMEDAIKVSEERNVALYCGEYGVIDRADGKEAQKWLKIFNSLMDRNGIGHAVWNYKKMDFEVEV